MITIISYQIYILFSCSWSCEAVRKLKVSGHTIIKRHFYILLGHKGRKRICEKGFKKEVYVLEDDSIFLVHYMGDETKSNLRAHGNSNKINKFFMRTQPSVLASLTRTTASQPGLNAHKVYKDAIEKGVSGMDESGENVEENVTMKKMKRELAENVRGDANDDIDEENDSMPIQNADGKESGENVEENVRMKKMKRELAENVRGGVNDGDMDEENDSRPIQNADNDMNDNDENHIRPTSTPTRSAYDDMNEENGVCADDDIGLNDDNISRPTRSVDDNMNDENGGNMAAGASEIIKLPRNVRQIKHIKEREEKKGRIGRDAILNLFSMAYEDEFIHYISVFPDLVLVCGNTLLIQELELIIKSRDNAILLSYDTTFNLGEFYVSPLLVKHVAFMEMPVIPILFLVHERKLTKHHEVLFQTLVSSLKISTKNVPIVTDMEPGIMLAIEKSTKFVQVGCWRHLRKDIESWVGKHDGGRDDKTVYVDDIFGLLKSKTETQFMDNLNLKKKKWSKAFVTYFEKHIHKKIKYFAVFKIGKFVKLDHENGITSNMSEGFNWLLKDLNKWKEGPIDCAILSFRYVQNYYLKEIQRGKIGFGQYTLKDKYTHLAMSLDKYKDIPVIPIRQIVNSIKQKDYLGDYQGHDAYVSNAHNTSLVRAKEIIKCDGISFNCKLGTFAVRGANGICHCVSLHPEKCTCPRPQNCIHIMAVRLSLNIATKDDYAKILNLTVLRQNARGRQKPGRKRPRPGDYDVEPARDSKVGKKHKHLPSLENKSLPSLDSLTTLSTLSEKSIGDVNDIGDAFLPDIDDVTDIPDKLTNLDRPKLARPRSDKGNHAPIISISDEILRADLVAVMESQLWVMDSNGVRINLSSADRELIVGNKDNGWLNDAIIDAAHALLRQKHPRAGGLQPCLYAARPCFQYSVSEFIQILNTHPIQKGLHWILLSSFMCPKDTVKIYDSAGGRYIGLSVQKCVAQLLSPISSKMTIQFMHCPQQGGGDDCGLYAIANATAILAGTDPSELTSYTTSKAMRAHLIRAFETGSLHEFSSAYKPKMKLRIRSQMLSKVYHSMSINLFCTCKMPEYGSYFECSTCTKWFHPECQGITASTEELSGNDTIAYCIGCYSGIGPQYTIK